MDEIPEELQPDKIRELESKCPEIVNFLRKAGELGTPTNNEVSNLVRKQEVVAKALMQAVEGRMPHALALNILKQMDHPNFVDGAAVHVGFPDKLRAFIQQWMDSLGVQFKYMEPKSEPR